MTTKATAMTAMLVRFGNRSRQWNLSLTGTEYILLWRRSSNFV